MTDNKRISKEKHEIAYVRSLCRELIENRKKKIVRKNSPFKTLRIAKAYLKATKGYSRSKK